MLMYSYGLWCFLLKSLINVIAWFYVIRKVCLTRTHFRIIIVRLPQWILIPRNQFKQMKTLENKMMNDFDIIHPSNEIRTAIGNAQFRINHTNQNQDLSMLALGVNFHNFHEKINKIVEFNYQYSWESILWRFIAYDFVFFSFGLIKQILSM